MPPSLSRLRHALVVVSAFALLATACGGDDEADSTTTAVPEPPTTTTRASTATTSAPSTSTSTTTATTTVVNVGDPSPLNGLPTALYADRDRRVVAVKVDNHPEARPQSGIQEADAVIELIVESGITRFIALFHTSDTEYIGPVRSGRPTDPSVVRPLDAVLQISGAQSWVQSIIRNAGVPFLGETGPNVFRIPQGSRAYERTLYGSTVAIREVSDDRGISDDPPVGPWFDFSQEPDNVTATTEPVTTAIFNWSSQWASVRWEWDGAEWLRFNGDTPHDWVDIDGERGQIAADLLVALMADQYTASGSTGSSVPALTTVGSGQAFVFHGGGVLEATWSRNAIEDFFVLTTPDGEDVVLPAGRIWLMMFPDHRTIDWE